IRGSSRTKRNYHWGEVISRWVNNPTLTEFCFGMIGRADIEGSKSNVAMNAWLPQASYPCGNFSGTSTHDGVRGASDPSKCVHFQNDWVRLLTKLF
ncbi:hypothetical protein DM02DRAFT_516546, partial [Periconia macrospinosa]